MGRHLGVLLAAGAGASLAHVAAATTLTDHLGGAVRGACGSDLECQLFETLWSMIGWVLTTL